MSLASQGKRKPTFEDAGTTQKEEANTESNTIDEIVDSVIHAPKPKQKEQVSIYLDYEVYKAFKKFASKNGKGSKSNLVNNFLKKALKEYM